MQVTTTKRYYEAAQEAAHEAIQQAENERRDSPLARRLAFRGRELSDAALIKLADLEAAPGPPRRPRRIRPDDRFQRRLALSPKYRAKLDQLDAKRADTEHAKWLASGEPDWMEELYEKRQADRIAEIAAMTDEQLEAASVKHRAQQIEIRDAAENEWLAFGGSATADQVDTWKEKHKRLMIPFERKLEPVTILPFRAPAAAPLPNLLVSSAEFVSGFVPPEYLIDGILQRRYFYSLTAQTGVGKTAIAMRWAAHVVSGERLGAADVEKGTVLYMAGENPTDVQARWLGLSRAMQIDPAATDMHFLVGAMDLSQVADRITAEVAAKNLHLALVVVDTAAAYNFGDDENNNSQMGNYARQLRRLTELPGGPCVVVLCHPTKRAGDDDLMPRGGGAFIAEVDGNMAVHKENGVLTVNPQVKFRGSQEWKLRYELEVVRDHPELIDAKGRAIPTVIAKPVEASAAAALETRSARDTEMVLKALETTPAATPAALARALGWT
jgi:hypothetical protein